MKKTISVIFIISIMLHMCIPINAATTDTTAPTIKSIVPSNNQKSVPLDQTITITFNEDIYLGKVVGETFYLDEMYIDGYVPVNVKISKKVLYIKPKIKLKPETDYVFSICSGAITDKAKNAIKKQFNFYFSTKKVSAKVQPTPTVGLKATATPTPATNPQGETSDNKLLKLRLASGNETFLSSMGNNTIAYGNGRFVLITGKTSTDGKTWLPNANYKFGALQIAYGKGKFVVVGMDGILYSDDGLKWQRCSVSDSMNGYETHPKLLLWTIAVLQKLTLLNRYLSKFTVSTIT